MAIGANNIGIKNMAKEASGRCPYFTPTKEFSDILESTRERHDDIKNTLKSHIESQGFQCKEEFDIVLPATQPNAITIKGRADLLCVKDQKHIILEIKSSYIDRGKAMDLYQAYLYGRLYKSIHGVEPIVITVYRPPRYEKRQTTQEKVVNINDIKLPANFIYIRIDISKDWIKIDEILSARGGGIYIIGSDCYNCVNNQCPIMAGLQKYSTQLPP